MKVKSLKIKIIEDQHGFILGLVLIFFLIFTILGLTFIEMSRSERVQVFNYYEKIKAYYYAEGGIQKALWLLNQVSAAQATFTDATVSVIYDANNLKLTATGQSGNAQKSIQVTLVPSDVWPYVLFTDTKKLELKKGKGTVTGNIHSNDKVDIDYKKYTVNGTVTEAAPTVTAPTVDWTFFKTAAIAAGQYFTSDIKFNSAGSPYSGVWYTTKKVKINKDAVINGTIVAKKDVKFEGDNTSVTATPSNYPAIISGKKIKVDRDGAQITGFVYCDDDFRPKGDNLTLIGVVVAIKKIDHADGDNKVITYNSNYAQNIAGINFNVVGNSKYKISRWEEL